MKKLNTKTFRKMTIEHHFEKDKDVQQKMLEFLDTNDNLEENYQNLMDSINKLDEESKLPELLYLILRISNHHQRTPNFFTKIERILINYKEEIKQTYSNSEIFNLFKKNYRILLFFLKENVITPEKMQTLEDKSFLSYFFGFYKGITSTLIKFHIGGLVYDTTKGDSELFEEKRIIGENDNYVCKLIREDMIEEFIVFVNKNGFTLWSQIEFSIFETNLYLIENNPTVIEYAAFFGSTQIFKYLYLNGCELTPSLWLYSIHGNNQEIIHILEENKIKPKDETYIECYNEAIKCHHNEMAEYFCKNFLDNKTIDDINHLSKSIKYSNFHFFPKNFKDNFAFHELCHFNYYWYVNYLIETEKIDINEKIIFKSFLFLNEVSN